MQKQLSKHTLSKLDKLLESVGDMALKRRAKKLITGINPEKGDRILDLGCGDGFYLYLLSNLGLKLRLVGCDYGDAELNAARRNLKGKRIPLYNGDLMKKLPFKDNYFDKIIMSEVAEHLPNDLKGLREVYRVLKPGGVLCLSVPNANYPIFWDPVNWILEKTVKRHIKNGFWAGFWFNHVRLYKPDQLRVVVEKAKFKIDKVESLTFWSLPFNHHIINIVARLLWGGKLPASIGSSVNKYQTKAKRPLLIALGFRAVNLIDRLNDLFSPKNIGVGVFVRAQK